MGKTFVAMNDRVQGLLRECTRHSPLRLWGREGAIRYEIRPESLSNSYYALASFHALQGFSVDETVLSRWRVQESEKPGLPYAAGYFDATRLDRRCAGDLRMRPAGHGPLMVAAELLSFGTGALRPQGYAGEHAWEFAEYGRLGSPLEVVFRRIGALCCGPVSSSHGVEKEVYCSTNLIYGDALGEVEQLWERRADSEFLQHVAEHLQQLRHWPQATVPTHAPLNYEAAIRLHLRAQAIWRKPPSSGRVLLRRLEFILEHTVIDSAPTICFKPAAPGGPGLPGFGPSSNPDRSGYDGWLGGAGSTLN